MIAPKRRSRPNKQAGIVPQGAAGWVGDTVLSAYQAIIVRQMGCRNMGDGRCAMQGLGESRQDILYHKKMILSRVQLFWGSVDAQQLSVMSSKRTKRGVNSLRQCWKIQIGTADDQSRMVGIC